MVLPLFYASAASQVFSFFAGTHAAKKKNEYLEKVLHTQEVNAANRAAVEVEGTAARAVQMRKAAAFRLDELSRFTRKGVAAASAASAAGGVVGATGSEAVDEFKARVSEKLAADLQNLQGEDAQIQRMLDSIPINQKNAVQAVQGVTGPSITGTILGITSSFFEIDAKYGPP